MRSGVFSTSKSPSPSHFTSSSPGRKSPSPSHFTSSSPGRKSPSPSHSTSSSPGRLRQTFSESMMIENIESAEAIIMKWDTIDGSTTNTNTYSKFVSLFRDYPGEAKLLMRAIRDLQNAMHYLIKHPSSSELLIRAQNLMERAMRRLEKEFHSILSTNRNGILDADSVSSRSARSSVSDDDEEDLQSHSSKYSATTVFEDLKTIADCMIGAGYGKECISLYKLVRKSTVDESLYNLGLLDKISFSNIQKLEWEAIELKIKNWLSSFKTAVKSVFLGERILCDYVFSSSEKVIEACFAEITKGRALVLLSFPEAVAKYKKLSAEKMFRFLDLYEAISTLWPEIEVIFSFESFSPVRSQAVTSLVKLGDAIRAMLSEFESAIQKDSSKAVLGGGIHPLTRYVMNYLVFLADYGDSIADIVADWPLPAKSPLPEAYFSTLSFASVYDGEDDGEESPVSVRLAWLVLVLLCKLDAKAELFKDVALAYLFLANNLNYIVSKVRQSSLGPVLGPEWIIKHEAKVKQYASNYERMGWSKVMTSFPENPTADMALNDVKEFFKRFNSGFEEAYKSQSSWVIPDPKLREQVVRSLGRKIGLIYREYYEKYRGIVRRDGFEPIIRFAPDDLGNYLSDLFHGAGGVSGSTTSYESSSHSSTGSTSRGR